MVNLNVQIALDGEGLPAVLKDVASHYDRKCLLGLRCVS